MAEASIGDTIERIVLGARLPTDAARDELRRELASHFEEAADSPAGGADVLRRFGNVAEVAEDFRHVYRFEFILSSVTAVLFTLLVCTVAAAATLLLVNLPFTSDSVNWLSGPHYRVPAYGVRMATALIVAWEMGRRPLTVRRVLVGALAYSLVSSAITLLMRGDLHAWRPWHVPSVVVIGFLARRARFASTRVLMMYAGFSLYLVMTPPPGEVPPLLLAAVLVAIWVPTEALLARVDRFLGEVFHVPMETSFRAPH